jgi:hypothetical protein
MTRAPSSIDSSASLAFGADVRVGSLPTSLFLVVGRAGPPDAALIAAGGKLVVRLDSRRVLATGPFDAMTPLARHPLIDSAGPVNVDLARLASFAALRGAAGG